MAEQKVAIYTNYASIIEIKKDIEQWLEIGYTVRAFLERGREVLIVYEREVKAE